MEIKKRERDIYIYYLLCHGPGCEGVQVEELWSLDKEQFKDLE